MESIIFEVNPSIKQFADNAQRMSDQLQRAQQKENKKARATKSVPIDSADISTEVDFMGGDLMGDMDPDQFRGRRSPHFPQRENHDDEKHEATEEQNENLQKLMDTLKSTSMARDLSPDPTAPRERVEEHPGKAESLPTAPEQKTETPGDSLAQPEKGDLADNSRGSPVSLLSWDNEFIIADPSKKPATEEDMAEARDYEALEIPEEDGEEDIEASQLIDEMLIARPDEAGQNRIRELLAPFGKRLLKLCRNFGSRIALLSPGETVPSFMPRAFYQETYNTIRAGYLPEMKLCFFGEEYLHEEKPFNAPRFYFAHAFDNALGRDEFASLKSAAVLSNYRACQEREPGHQFLDLFSAASPVHYFAQAVESYLTDEQGKEILCSREGLYDCDRSMYLYVEYLFSEINREPSKRFGMASGERKEKP